MIFRRPLIGEEHPLAKLHNPQAAQIRARYEQGGTSYRQLGREYGVSHVTVFKIVLGVRYSPHR